MKAFLVLCVVGLLAAAEARFIFELPLESDALESSIADMDLKLAELLPESDDERQSQRFDSGPFGSDYKKIVVPCANVDDPVTGIKGRLCLLVVYTYKTFFTALYLDRTNFYGSYLTPDILDQFGEGFCVQGKATKRHTVCLNIYGNSSLTDRTITARAMLIRDGKVICDLGWFKVIQSAGANVDEALKASFPEVDESQKEFDVEVERLRIRERMPMNANLFPRDDERL